MKGTLYLKGSSDPRIERTITFHVGGGAVCLEQAGLWELTPDPQFVKLAQRTFEIDTSQPNEIDLAPKYMAIEGKLQFESENKIDEFLDYVGMRVNGQDFWEFEDMDEIDSEPLSRKYKIWVPYEFLHEN